MANVVLGMPTMGTVQAQTFEALMKINRGDHKLCTLITEYSLVYMARDNIVKRMLENPESDYLWFVDSDIVPDKETLNALIADDKDIVSAVYPYRAEGDGIVGADFELHTLTIKDVIADDENGEPRPLLKQIRRCGMGCCLIKRNVLEKVLEKYESCFTPTTNVGEDYAFCELAGDLGFTVWIDGGVWCKHIGQKTYEV